MSILVTVYSTLAVFFLGFFIGKFFRDQSAFYRGFEHGWTEGLTQGKLAILRLERDPKVGKIQASVTLQCYAPPKTLVETIDQ